TVRFNNRKSAYSKSGHFYFGETGHFYFGLTWIVRITRIMLILENRNRIIKIYIVLRKLSYD
ncbi:hypothetical protein, partial [Acinetobacter lwoffii]|uniref:hypothetical protein n=1 Tax=Acinetobacter lwoffii TaxID=28090 RepID=UPI00209AA71A